jgi:hypothetical protein
MNRRSRPIASEQAEVAKRDQNVSLGDVEETETSLWLHEQLSLAQLRGRGKQLAETRRAA